MINDDKWLINEINGKAILIDDNWLLFAPNGAVYTSGF
jgi:hypothetical protein